MCPEGGGTAPIRPRWRIGLVSAMRPSSAHRGEIAIALALLLPPLGVRRKTLV